MGQSSFNAALAPRRVVDRAAPAPPRRSPEKKQPGDLDLKLAALQKDYADLHTAIFEAAQVHRRLCAPRLLRYEEFEIASEIFAVRHLPGDFFTAEETKEGVVVALGDICGKGLAAGPMTWQLNEQGGWAWFDAGTSHEIRNVGAVPLELIEVDVRR